MVDYLIVTTLSVETEAVIRQFEISEGLADDSGLIAFRCSLTAAAVGAPTVILISTLKMGRVEAAVATTRALAKWKPRTVLLVGVGAGLPGRAQLGDVLVATQVVDDSVRQDKEDGDVSARTQVYRMSNRMRARIQAAEETDWRTRVVPVSSNVRPTVRIGSILSTDREVPSLGALQHVRSTFRDLTGVDMAGGGVAAAINGTRTPPDLLVIRGVAEIVEEGAKSFDWREFAAWAAAAFAVAIIRVTSSNTREATNPPTGGDLSRAEHSPPHQLPMPEEERKANQNPEKAEDLPWSIQDDKSTPPPSENGPHPPPVLANAAWLKKDAIHFSRSPMRTDSCLRADQYASVLAKLFDRARGEFCFGIFGHWGRGKTYLMERVQKILESPPAILPAGRLRGWIQKILESPSASYRCVWFRAWKYPTTPELWIHLYETLVEATLKGSWFEAQARTVRVNITRHGLGPLTASLFGLALTLLPLGIWLKLAEPLRLIISVIGIIGVLRFGKLFQGMRQTVAHLSEKYLSIARHSERLGLQQTIGRDLECLLNGWIPQADQKVASGDSNQAWQKVTPWWRLGLLSIASIAVSVTLSIALWPSPDSRLFDAIQIGMPRWLAPSFVILWICLVVSTWWCVANGGRAITRVVLVIDDLDRCAPDHLLGLVESLKLLLEDRAISDRVQVAFLVEEEVLAATMLKKYERVLLTKTVSSYTERRVVQENLEKLILGHLRLPPLSPLELVEILNHFAHPDNTRSGPAVTQGKSGSAPSDSRADAVQQQTAQARDASKAIDQQTAKTATDQKRETSSSLPEHGTDDKPPEQLSIFNTEEYEALSEALVTLLKKKEAAVLGPRAIQSFLLRFQLARLLLDVRGAVISPKEVAKELASAWGEAPHSYLPQTGNDQLNMVAREVM